MPASLSSSRWSIWVAMRWILIMAVASGCQDIVTPKVPPPVAGPPALIAVRAGALQADKTGSTVARPPAVIVTDTAGIPVAGVSVHFTVTSGGGAVSTDNTVTDSAGIATAGAWTLGASPGSNTLSASAPDVILSGDPVPFVAAATSNTPAFHIELRPSGAITPTQADLFTQAIARWQAIISQNFPLATSVVPGLACGGVPATSEAISGLLVYVSVTPGDGPSGVLASTTPCLLRYIGLGLVPLISRIAVDAADASTLETNGQLLTVLTHELGHALGLGILWRTRGMIQDPWTETAFAPDPHYTGGSGLAAFDAIGGAGYSGSAKVPVENNVASGANVHWRESVLHNELMTGVINSGANPLSLLSVRALEDLGYSVNSGSADAFTLSAASAMSLGAARQPIDLGNDVVIGPTYVLQPDGSITQVPVR